MTPELPLRYDYGAIYGSGNPDEVSLFSSWDVSGVALQMMKDEINRQKLIDVSRQLHKELILIRSIIGTNQARQELDQIPLSSKYRSLIYQVEYDIDCSSTPTATVLEKTTSNSKDKSDSPITESGDRDLNLCTSGAATKPTQAPTKRRKVNFENRIEHLVQLMAYQYFLESSQLLMPSAVPWATDEEYLVGACMGLSQDLAHYGLGRATVRDVTSVKAAAILVQDINEFLLQLDFRNGYLRRQYDGIKYCHKDLETLLYELSITGATDAEIERTSKSSVSEGATDEDLDSSNKRLRTVNQSDSGIFIPSSSLISKPEELVEIQRRMSHRDELRESLIKKSRDGQKAAKHAIFALHRNSIETANKLLNDCRRNLCDVLMPIVDQDPFLRNAGSFTSVVEEYVEAKLFAAWLVGVESHRSHQLSTPNANCITMNDASTAPNENKQNLTSFLNSPSSKKIPCHLLMTDEFELSFELTPVEYLGGLCDLTGEIGRYAVTCGTSRDVSAVMHCLATNQTILTALQVNFVEKLPGSIVKKIESVRRSVSKLQRMLYEISLSEAAGGGRKIQSDVIVDHHFMSNNEKNNNQLNEDPDSQQSN